MRLWKISTAEIDIDTAKKGDKLKSSDELSNVEIETYLARYLGQADPVFGAAAPPIYQTSTHTFDDWDAVANAFDNRVNTPFYGRQLNPTVQLAEEVLARLAGAERARLFASGMAAITAALLASLKTGDHIVAVNGVYGPAGRCMANWLPQKAGISASFVSALSADAFIKACTPKTRVIYLETPSSGHFELQDIAAIADMVQDRDIRIIVDNTWATPLRQRPLALGAHLEIHSASKYLGGHSDVIAGVLLGNAELIESIAKDEAELLGARLAPLEAWLLLRGLRTLPSRLDAHERNGLIVAEWLETHPKVSRVAHPGLKSHPQHELAQRQMSGSSSLFSFDLATEDAVAIKRFFDGLKLFGRGVSWGGHESLIFAPAISAHKEQSPERLKAMDLGIRTIRVSIGLEHARDLVADLDQALNLI